MKIAFVIKGISGSGKSTRTLFLINELRESGFTEEPVLFNNKVVGLLFPALNVVFLGKEQKKGLPFQGYDSCTGTFEKAENLSLFMKESSYSFVIEGASITDSHRLRPEFLRDYCGFNKVLMQYYNFHSEQKDFYIKRITDRSGKPPSKDSMFNKIKNFEGDCGRALNEIKGEDIVHYDTPDTPISDFCEKFLNFI